MKNIWKGVKEIVYVIVPLRLTTQKEMAEIWRRFYKWGERERERVCVTGGGERRERMWAAKLGRWRSIAKEAAQRSMIIVKFLCLLHVTDNYIVSPTIVHGPSMLPTLNMRGDVLLAERISHRFGRVSLGDIIFVRSPVNPNRILTKRVLGLEGDVVSFNDGSWHNSVTKTSVVPKGHVWIQGDNVYASTDSRHYGPIPYGLIQGKALCRVWPLDGFRSLGP